MSCVYHIEHRFVNVVLTVNILVVVSDVVVVVVVEVSGAALACIDDNYLPGTVAYYNAYRL